MKKFKVLSLIYFSLLLCFVFTGCGLGSYDLEFILPDGTVYKTITYGPNDANLKSSITPSNIIGYNFLGWSETEELNSVITIPYAIKTNKLYAKYEIDRDYFYNYSTIDFNAEGVSLNVNAVLQNTYYILINDNSESINIEQIEIVANNSSFMLQSAKLRNFNSKVISEIGVNGSNLIVGERGNIQTSYVLEITAALNENFTINVY